MPTISATLIGTDGFNVYPGVVQIPEGQRTWVRKCWRGIVDADGFGKMQHIEETFELVRLARSELPDLVLLVQQGVGRNVTLPNTEPRMKYTDLRVGGCGDE